MIDVGNIEEWQKVYARNIIITDQGLTPDTHRNLEELSLSCLGYLTSAITGLCGAQRNTNPVHSIVMFFLV